MRSSSLKVQIQEKKDKRRKAEEKKENEKEKVFKKRRMEQMKSEMAFKNLYHEINGEFYIYTLSNPCLKYMLNYKNLLKLFPKVKFRIYYSLLYNDIKNKKTVLNCYVF